MPEDSCVFQNILFKRTHKLFQLHYEKNIPLEPWLSNIAQSVKTLKRCEDILKLGHQSKPWSKKTITIFAAYCAYHNHQDILCLQSYCSYYLQPFRFLYTRIILPIVTVVRETLKPKQIT